MSTFGFLPRRSIILGFRAWIISKLRAAACLSFVFVPFLSLRFPSSFKTSWGTSHSIGWDVIWFVISGKSIFCLTQVRMKFVSSRIFMVG